MARLFILPFIFCLYTTFSFGQNDVQKSILTDDGIFTVSKTETGKDMLLINADLWNDMVKGTKFIFEKIAGCCPAKAFIQIANKKLCFKTGIGFRCSITDRTAEPCSVLVNNLNRICSVVIERQDINTVKIIFLDNVDWASLQNDQ